MPTKGNGHAAIHEKERAVPEYREVVVSDEVQRIEVPEQVRPPVQTFIGLQPIAAPVVLGLLALSSSLFIVGANLLGWFGVDSAPESLFPFVALFGGLMQVLAGMWAYRARDTLATVLHGAWGAFWLGYGALYLMVANGTIASADAAIPVLGLWLVPLAALSWVVTAASIARSLALVLTVGALAISATLGAIGYLTGTDGIITATAVGFVVTSILGLYTGSAVLLNNSFARSVLPLVRFRNYRGIDIVRGYGEPGVMPYE